MICRDPHYKDELSIITDDVRMDGLLNLTCRDCRNKTKADNDQMNQLDWQLLCSMKWLTRALRERLEMGDASTMGALGGGPD